MWAHDLNERLNAPARLNTAKILGRRDQPAFFVPLLRHCSFVTTALLRCIMYILILVAATVLVLFLVQRPRRRAGEAFDWTYRRPWYKPRWIFPDDR
jgi:hypothetical protein